MTTVSKHGPAIRLDFGGWDVESLRFSIFFPTGATPPGSGLWEEVTGTTPESIDSRPRESVVLEVGNIGRNQLLLATQNQRLDWHIRPILTSTPRARTLMVLADVEETLPVLQKAVQCSLETVRQVHRFAFAPVLVKQAPSLNEGLRQLSKYLPDLRLGSLGGSDFIYQINRRRSSKVAALIQINRLAKWVVEEFQVNTLSVNPSQGARLQTTKSGFASKLTLDINTTPGSGEVSRDTIPELFDELVMLACEVATKGDVP